jgi:hypothetical protein
VAGPPTTAPHPHRKRETDETGATIVCRPPSADPEPSPEPSRPEPSRPEPSRLAGSTSEPESCQLRGRRLHPHRRPSVTVWRFERNRRVTGRWLTIAQMDALPDTPYLTRPRVRARVALAATLGAAMTLAFFACLPDLVAPDAPPALEPIESGDSNDAAVDVDGAPPPRTCGDGIINVDAGESCDPGKVGEAGVAGCTQACAAKCEGIVIGASGHCYFGLPNPLPFEDAERACVNRRAHVVTFASADEFTIVAKKIPLPASAQNYWVGLKALAGDTMLARFLSATEDEPGFAPSARCPGCYGNVGTRAPESTFPRLSPDGGAASCVVSPRRFVPGDPWFRAQCSTPQSVLCEREPVGTRAYPCARGTCVQLARTEATKRYLYVPIRKIAVDARRSCKQLASGRLVAFGSSDEREELFRELARAGALDAMREFWIGLAFDADAGVWRWDDGIPATTDDRIPWADGEPKSSAVDRAYAARVTGEYDTQLARSASGDASLPFVCEYAP